MKEEVAVGTLETRSGVFWVSVLFCFNHDKYHVSALPHTPLWNEFQSGQLSKIVKNMNNLCGMNLNFLKSLGFLNLPNINEIEKLKRVHDPVHVYSACLMGVIYQIFRKYFAWQHDTLSITQNVHFNRHTHQLFLLCAELKTASRTLTHMFISEFPSDVSCRIITTIDNVWKFFQCCRGVS